jgi:hypothetical protein
VAVEPVAAGWYPSKRGMLRYWDGAAWTGHYAPIPAGPNPRSAQGERRAQVLGVVAVALMVCCVLVGLVWGITGDFLIDDSQPVITITPSVR